MKKLFTLLFAVVTVAAFAAPALQKASKQQPQKASANIEMQAKKGALYTGKAGMMKDFTTGVDTMYMTPVGTFYSSFFPYNGSLLYSYNMALVPGKTELTWKNISTGIASDTYDWVYYNPSIDEEYLTQVEGQKDLVCEFPSSPTIPEGGLHQGFMPMPMMKMPRTMLSAVLCNMVASLRTTCLATVLP